MNLALDSNTQSVVSCAHDLARVYESVSREKVCGIYKITSPSGNFYIGSSFDVSGRWQGHRSDLRRGKHHSPPLQHAANKYGVDSFVFSLICECERDVARSIEQLAINHLRPEYNATQNTREPLSALWLNAEFRAKTIKASSEQIRLKWKDPAFVEKQRAASSKALAELHRDPVFAAAHKLRVTARLRALVHTPIVQEKAAEGRRARIASDREDPKKWADRHARIRAIKDRPVICVETGVTFSSQTVAGAWLLETHGYRSSGHISNCLAGRIKKAYGYTWQYADGRIYEADADKVHGKRVLCVENGMTFTSTAEAARWLQKPTAPSISACARGQRKSAYGYTWRYLTGDLDGE